MLTGALSLALSLSIMPSTIGMKRNMYLLSQSRKRGGRFGPIGREGKGDLPLKRTVDGVRVFLDRHPGAELAVACSPRCDCLCRSFAPQQPTDVADSLTKIGTRRRGLCAYWLSL